MLLTEPPPERQRLTRTARPPSLFGRVSTRIAPRSRRSPAAPATASRRRDWLGTQADAAERLALYRQPRGRGARRGLRSSSWTTPSDRAPGLGRSPWRLRRSRRPPARLRARRDLLQLGRPAACSPRSAPTAHIEYRASPQAARSSRTGRRCAVDTLLRARTTAWDRARASPRRPRLARTLRRLAARRRAGGRARVARRSLTRAPARTDAPLEAIMLRAVLPEQGGVRRRARRTAASALAAAGAPAAARSRRHHGRRRAD